MNDTISINVNIANRSYPLKVTKDKEEAMMQAVKLVNDRLKEYETVYSGRDPQDLLAMCALQLASEQSGVHLNNENREAAIKRELELLSDLVKNFQ